MKIAPVDSVLFAKSLIVCAEQREICISNLKLQKLAYYCQGYTLALMEQQLFDGKIVAWEHGPVVPAMYHEFKDFGSNSIPATYSSDLLTAIPDVFLDIVNFVLDKFGKIGPWDLVHRTHGEDPWLAHYDNEAKAVDGSEITHEELKLFFCQEVDRMQDASFARLLDSLDSQLIELPQEVTNKEQFFSWLQGGK
ncbi:type II toxin-antitoxin system antitoxin SocA domain-containing protein [Photobacterium piscicola]|uniref:Panacea domain-containing protein n=1 Tax=Photobacterium piscicola TaxID=1378299 RepID=UPI002E1931B0|nr:type II toxin-antitoxin system antitoxin SocA domain-containing protein [Photobacterium piscicola]